jgi:hypothetical protein
MGGAGALLNQHEAALIIDVAARLLEILGIDFNLFITRITHMSAPEEINSAVGPLGRQSKRDWQS